MSNLTTSAVETNLLPNNLPGMPSYGQLPEHMAFTENPLSAYSKDLFFARLAEMREATADYHGELPLAWQKSQSYGIAQKKEEQPPIRLDKYNEDQTSIIVKTMRNAGVTSAVIEAAHVYLYEDIGNPDLRSSVVSQSYFGAAITQRLEAAGIATRNILFVDNYNPDPLTGEVEHRLNVDELVELTQSAGFRPELVMQEADMQSLALSMIEVMRTKQNLVKVIEDQVKEADSAEVSAYEPTSLQLTRRKIELYTVAQKMVSCSMLDAALSMVKLCYQGDGVVNVLPRGPNGQPFSYKGQQKKMRTIVNEHLSVKEGPFFNIYVGYGTECQRIAAGANNVFRKKR